MNIKNRIKNDIKNKFLTFYPSITQAFLFMFLLVCISTMFRDANRE